LVFSQCKIHAASPAETKGEHLSCNEADTCLGIAVLERKRSARISPPRTRKGLSAWPHPARMLVPEQGRDIRTSCPNQSTDRDSAASTKRLEWRSRLRGRTIIPSFFFRARKRSSPEPWSPIVASGVCYGSPGRGPVARCKPSPRRCLQTCSPQWPSGRPRQTRGRGN